MKQTLAAVLIVAAFTILVSLVYNRLPGLPTPQQTRVLTATSSPTVEIGGRAVRVTIADDAAEREKGLGGRESLAPDEGMLFIFMEDGRHGFWMKDMRFSIDILWLSAEGKIVDIAPNVSPDTYPASAYLPNVPARYVLELPAGYVERYTVKIGDIVRL